MRRCWNDEPTGRPTFDALVAWIDDVVSSKAPSAGARRTGDDSRLYLNVAGRRLTAARPPSYCQPAAAALPADASASSKASEDDRVEEQVRYM